MGAATLRVATWNLEHASPRRPKHGRGVRAVMNEAAADVWVLTESDPGFAPADGYRLLACSAEPRDLRTGRAWVAIWARETLNACVVPALAADPSRTAAACVHHDGHAPILVYGTVLPWRSDVLWPGRFSEAFGSALAAQAAEWTALKHKHGAELCVAGDFNQELTGRICVGSRAGRDALHRVLCGVLPEDALSCPTSAPHDPVGEILGRGSIDHILISAGLRPAAGKDGRPRVTVIPPTRPLPRELSDHYGVCVELTAAAAAPRLAPSAGAG